ncbi:MAG TPA: hypothetical protein VHH36_04795 [Candidatus Thermoplasmatota archaeon]|nr:hypothetical protein [Candidatus Thermoplasmatota archaeon]
MDAPGSDAVLALAAKLPRGVQALEVDDGSASLAPRLAALGLHVTATRPGPALAPPGSVDAFVCQRPTRLGPLLPLLGQLRAALVEDGAGVVSEIVWQTAPTPDLIRAFAPPPGREKVRPIEGFEMQVEHAGFAIVERLDADRAAWAKLLPDAQRDAVLADDRGAARLCAWLLRSE